MQIDDLSNLSDIDDLASTFAKVCHLFWNLTLSGFGVFALMSRMLPFNSRCFWAQLYK